MTDYIVLVTAWSQAGLLEGSNKSSGPFGNNVRVAKIDKKVIFFTKPPQKPFIHSPSRVVPNSCMHQWQKTKKANCLTAKVQLSNGVTTNQGEARMNALGRPTKVCARLTFACAVTPLRGKSSSLFPKPIPRPPTDTNMAMSELLAADADRGCPA